MSKVYIAVLDKVPVHMVPVLVAHAILGAHLVWKDTTVWLKWLNNSFKKCVLKVNTKEFNKIILADNVYLGHENTVLEGHPTCAVLLPREEYPNVIKFAKLWAPS